MENNTLPMANDIINAFQKYQESDAYQQLITKHIEKMVSDSLNQVFGWNGAYRQQFEALLTEAMPKNLEDMVDLAKYHTLFTQSLEATWESNALPTQVVKTAQETVLKFTDNFQIPEYVRMSELIEAFVSDHEEEAQRERWECPLILFNREDRKFNEFIEIGIDSHKEESSIYRVSKSKDSAFSFDNNLYLTREGKDHEGHPVFKLYSGRLENQQLGVRVARFYSDFERLVACMYFGGSLLVLDTEDFDDFTYDIE